MLLACLVPHPVALTAVRTAAPTCIVGVIAAAFEGNASDVALAAGGAWAVVMTAVALAPAVGMAFVNGPAYANERRFPLAVPRAVLLGPLELAWALMMGLPATTLFLVANHHWVVGAICAALAVPVVALLGRAMHGLSRRWVVFVPAGMVLHDHLALVDPVLFTRTVIDEFGPARVDSDALDLTQGAPGLALELVLHEKVPMTRVRSGRRGSEEGASARLLFTPTRPGAVLAEADHRRIRTAAR